MEEISLTTSSVEIMLKLERVDVLYIEDVSKNTEEYINSNCCYFNNKIETDKLMCLVSRKKGVHF